MDKTQAEEAERLIREGADLNAQDDSGKTALMWAAGWHHPEIVEVLLKHGAGVDLQDRKGRTALSWAARWRNPGIVPLLLKHGAKVGLVEALSLQDEVRVRQLLALGKGVNGRGAFGETPLMIAAERADLELALELLKRGAGINDRDDRGWTALMWAVGPPPQISSHGFRSEVRDPVAGRRPALIRTLIGRGADPDAVGYEHNTVLDRDGLSALMRAAEYGSIDAVKALVESGADLNVRSRKEKRTALRVAVQSSRFEAVDYLLTKGAGVDIRDTYGQTPLHTAANAEELRIAQALLDHGADINARDRTGTTPLVQSNAGSVQFLIDRGADVGIRSRNGESALMWAAMRRQHTLAASLRARTPEINLLEALYLRDEDSALTLIARGKGLQSRDSYRSTPLMIAAQFGLRRAATALARHKGALIERNMLDQTALSVACEAKDEEMVRLLLQLGADPLAKSRLDATPLSIAKENGSDRIVRILEEAVSRKDSRTR